MARWAVAALASFLLSVVLPAFLLPSKSSKLTLTCLYGQSLPPSLSSTEAEKTAQIREAGLEMELHQCRIAATTERYRAEQFSLAVVEVSLHRPAYSPSWMPSNIPQYCTFHSSPSV